MQVGIFFYVDGIFLTDKVNLENAHVNTLFMEYGEHYNFWLNLSPANEVEAKFKTNAYDYFARGRVVYDRSNNCFYLYADRCLKTSKLIELTELFDLDMRRVKMRLDQHYQCCECNQLFVNDIEY